MVTTGGCLVMTDKTASRVCVLAKELFYYAAISGAVVGRNSRIRDVCNSAYQRLRQYQYRCVASDNGELARQRQRQ